MCSVKKEKNNGQGIRVRNQGQRWIMDAEYSDEEFDCVSDVEDEHEEFESDVEDTQSVDFSSCEMYSVPQSSNEVEQTHAKFVTCLAPNLMILMNCGNEKLMSELRVGDVVWTADGADEITMAYRVTNAPMFKFDKVTGCASILCSGKLQHMSQGEPTNGDAIILRTRENSVICINGKLVDITQDYKIDIIKQKDTYTAQPYKSVNAIVVSVELN